MSTTTYDISDEYWERIKDISRMCKKHLNKTPTALVKELRLEYAARQLIITELRSSIFVKTQDSIH